MQYKTYYSREEARQLLEQQAKGEVYMVFGNHGDYSLCIDLMEPDHMGRPVNMSLLDKEPGKWPTQSFVVAGGCRATQDSGTKPTYWDKVLQKEMVRFLTDWRDYV